MYKRFIHLFVLSCEKATFLIEKQLHHPLSPLEKLKLCTHLSLCKYCIAYKTKAIFIDKLLADERTATENGHLFSEEEVGNLKVKFKSVIKQTNETDPSTLSSSKSSE